VVVTTSGDRFGLTGWRIGGTGSGATGAALDEARQKADAAALAVEQADEALRGARAALADARQVEEELAAKLDENDGRLAAATDGLQRVETDKRDAGTEAETLQSHLDELAERMRRERERVAELELALPGLEAEEAENAERGRTMGDARAHLEERAASVGAMRTDVEVRTMQVAERRQFLERRIGEIDQRLVRMEQQRAEAQVKRLELDQRQVVTERLIELVAERTAVVEERLGELRERRRKQSEAARAVAVELDGLRKERADRERRLAELREREQRLEIEQAETNLRLEAAIESLRHDHDVEPDVAIAAELPELPDNTNPKARVRELERELKIMGPINPLALQEFEELSQRHDFLEQQLADVKESRRELHKIIKAIDEEIVNVFASAFADVSQNFTDLFGTLFPGGQGRLRLNDPENLLETGIEVEAKPSGKNVKKLSLLSGGERSLTALAYLFAVFRSRPSPFYVMDEVEAALDDVNLHRFLDLLHEFREEAQLIIVSHQKRTMETADMLYGVTMQPGASSKVVSEKVAAGA